MGFLSKLFSRSGAKPDSVLSVSPPQTEGARDFIQGRKNTFTSADIDPLNEAYFARYEEAMASKQRGDLLTAEKLLRQSCEPPSIYKGHYRELFRIWREFNRRDLEGGEYQSVLDRVLTMIRYDDELIAEMLRHWSRVQERPLPSDYFDGNRNLLVSDAKAMHKAASALNNEAAQNTASALLLKFSSTKAKKQSNSASSS